MVPPQERDVDLDLGDDAVGVDENNPWASSTKRSSYNSVRWNSRLDVWFGSVRPSRSHSTYFTAYYHTEEEAAQAVDRCGRRRCLQTHTHAPPAPASLAAATGPRGRSRGAPLSFLASPPCALRCATTIVRRHPWCDGVACLRRYLYKLKGPEACNFPIAPELAAELDGLTMQQIHDRFRTEVR